MAAPVPTGHVTAIDVESYVNATLALVDTQEGPSVTRS
jgi:hypothetical protein